MFWCALAEPTALEWWLLVFGAALLGGCVGSFLNVVIYRLPRGMSLVRPGSHCPSCRRTIAWYDNVPFLSWWILHGRCRNCGTTISRRYLTVEILIAATSVLLALRGPLSERTVFLNDDFESLVLWGEWVYHLWLLAALWSVTFIELDGFDSDNLVHPWRCFFFTFLVGVGAPLVVLAWVGWLRGPVFFLTCLDRQWFTFQETFLGGIGGLGMGLLVWPATANGPLGTRGRLFVITNLVWLGVFLGYEAVAWLSAVTALAYLMTIGWVRCRTNCQIFPWSLSLCVVVSFGLFIGDGALVGPATERPEEQTILLLGLFVWVGLLSLLSGRLAGR